MSDPRLLITNPLVLRTQSRKLEILHKMAKGRLYDQVGSIFAHASGGGYILLVVDL